MKDHSAFIGGFTGALGVLAAFLLCAVVGVYLVREQAREAVTKHNDRVREPPWRLEHARELARAHLLKHGIAKVSDDSQLGTLDGKLYLIGHGLDESNRLRKVLIQFDVATFDGKEHWKIVSTAIDSKTVYGSPPNR